MAKRKKAVRVLDLVKNKAKEIEIAYEKAGLSINGLANKFGCSHNTMMITLGTLGYEVEPWTKPFVEKNLARIKNDKDKRTKKIVNS